MDFDTFVNTAWNEHGDDPEGVFAQLESGGALASTARDISRWVGLATHVAGEHLGRWEAGMAFVDQALASELLADEDGMRRSLFRTKAMLQYGAGDVSGADALLQEHLDPEHPPASSRVRMLASASSALAGQGRIDEAEAALQEAVSLAAYGPAPSDPAARSLAISGNNLAMSLEEIEPRTDAQTALMLLAARTARTWWEVAGTDTNVMLAEVRLACSLLAAGDAVAALPHATTAREMGQVPDTLAGYRLQAVLALGRALHATGAAEAGAMAAEARATLAEVPEAYHAFYTPQVDALEALVSG